MVLIRQRERAQLTRNGLLLAVFLASTVILLDNGKSLTGAVKMTDEDRLLEELFKRRHYNPDTRPAERANDVVAVEFEITPKQLTEIDSLNEVMRILIGIDMRWTDFRLAWNESDYGGLSRISIPFSKIWRPDIILTNSAEQWKKQAEMNVVVSSDGTCRWFPTMMAVSYCSIDIQWFPFDEQTCPLDFGSSSYDVSQLHVTSKREKNISDLCMGSSEWDLVEYSSIDSTVLYDGGFLSSSHVIFTFRWRRLTLYYGVIMILPCTMLFLISVVTYFIPPQMGDRISLAITTLLAMGVHQMMVSDSVPPTSDATPLIGVYFTSMMTTNAVSLIAMIVIYHLYHRSSTKPKPSDRVKSCVERLEKCLRMTEPSKDGKKQQNANSKKGKLCVEAAVKMTDEDRLLEELFRRRHYNPDSRPAERADDVVAVEIAIMPKQLATIDCLNEIMQMLIWIDMVWTDFRLAWNESDYGGISLLVVPFSKLWSPDIVIMNRADKWNRFSDVNIVVTSDGGCRWYPPIVAVSYCPIDIRWFPFDEQMCVLEFESWSYDTSKLNLTTKSTPIIDEHYKRNSEWDLIEISHNYTIIDYFVPFAHLEFTFHWRRRTLFYGFNMIMPCSLLSALSAVTFIIPPQTGERIGLGISTLLAMSVNQLIVADRVPPTSDAIPLIGIYFGCVMTANALSLMAMVGISNLYHRSSMNMHPMPDWVKSLVCVRLGKLLRMTKPTQDRQTRQIADCPEVKSNTSAVQFNKGKFLTETNHNVSPSTDEDVANEQTPEGEDALEVDEWKYAALVIDRLCFCICVLYMTTITLAFYACAFVIQSFRP